MIHDGSVIHHGTYNFGRYTFSCVSRSTPQSVQNGRQLSTEDVAARAEGSARHRGGLPCPDDAAATWRKTSRVVTCRDVADERCHFQNCPK